MLTSILTHLLLLGQLHDPQSGKHGIGLRRIQKIWAFIYYCRGRETFFDGARRVHYNNMWMITEMPFAK